MSTTTLPHAIDFKFILKATPRPVLWKTKQVNAQLQTYKSRVPYLRRRPPDGCPSPCAPTKPAGVAADLSLILRLGLQTTAKRLN